jgi:hypothetical protein
MNLEHLLQLRPGVGDQYLLLAADHVLHVAKKSRWEERNEHGDRTGEEAPIITLCIAPG